MAAFGPRTREQVAEVDGYTTAADLMVNSRYDPELEEVSAFEDQVSSHGGLGGPQTHPFLLYPAGLSAPTEPIFTSPAMHRVLKGWLAEVGHPVDASVDRRAQRRAVAGRAGPFTHPITHASKPHEGEAIMTIGPIQAFLIGFPENDLFEGRIADELMRLSDIGQIRVIDAVFVIREEDEIAVVSVSDLDDEQRAELREAVGALVGLGLGGIDGAAAGVELADEIDADAPTAAEVLALELLDDLPAGSSALVLAIEHLWAVPLRDAVRDAGGIVIGHPSLSVEDLIALGMVIGAEADAEAEPRPTRRAATGRRQVDAVSRPPFAAVVSNLTTAPMTTRSRIICTLTIARGMSPFGVMSPNPTVENTVTAKYNAPV